MQTKHWILFTTAWMMMNADAPAQKQTPPEGTAPKDFVLPSTTSFTLENGLQATMIPYGSLPKVTIRAVIRAGNVNEGPDEIWLSDLMADYLEEGTTTRSAKEVAKAAAGMGGDVSVGVSEDQMSVAGNVLSEYAAGMVELLADVIMHPLFPESELARLKNDQIRDLSIQKTDPNTIASARFRALLYPDHPYGRMLPTEEMLQGYTLQQAKSFYEANIGAARTHIYVAGKFDAAEVEQSIRKAFGSWAKGPEPLMNIPKPVSRRAVYLIDRPGAPQSTVYIGLPTINPGDPDYRKLLVVNSLLGGSFMSRITSNIREAKGYTYSPGSSVSTRYRDAYWAQFASITTEVTGPALKEIFYEIGRLQSEPPDAEELKGIQNYLAGVFVLQNSSAGGIINLLSFIDLHGLPKSYLTEYVSTIHSVTPQEVSALAAQYLPAGQMQIVIAGDVKKIEKQVASFGTIVR